jgi:S-DNA-T family DNA segregation ATPase FtsK/SpoIIIE
MNRRPANVTFNNIAYGFDDKNIPLIIGPSHGGSSIICDLIEMPHLLIGGTTGSGKSVLLHSMLCGIIESKKNIKLALIDPKRVEFPYYKDIKQLMYPVATNCEQALNIMYDLIEEMNERFEILQNSHTNLISEYNSISSKQMPYIVLVIDEFSDLAQTAKKEFQEKICRLAAMSRAAGIHIIMATQRPSVNVVTGLIKANFPARISFMVPSLIDSRVILDTNGAQKLLGKGDGIIHTNGFNMVRFQGAFITTNEIKRICKNNKKTIWNKITNYLK